MDKPLTTWYCDVCGEPIVDKEDGYVIWQTDEQREGHSFKIIHHVKCDLKGYNNSRALDLFTGEEGLVWILAFLSPGPIIGEGHCRVASLDEFVDLVRRVQTPYYEEARQYFSTEKALELFSDSNEVAPYLPDELERIIRVCQAP